MAQSDVWPQEREGYSENVTPAYAPVAKPTYQRSYPASVRTEERIGSIIAGIGMILVAQSVTKDLPGVLRLGIMHPGPLETCAIGILIWLHAKWRRASRVG
jgi:hypothetical protein